MIQQDLVETGLINLERGFASNALVPGGPGEIVQRFGFDEIEVPKIVGGSPTTGRADLDREARLDGNGKIAPPLLEERCNLEDALVAATFRLES